MYAPQQVTSLIASAKVVAGQRKPTLPALSRLQKALAVLQPYTLNIIAHEHRHGVTPLAVLVPGATTTLSEQAAMAVAGYESDDYGIDVAAYPGDGIDVLPGDPGPARAPVAPRKNNVTREAMVDRLVERDINRLRDTFCMHDEIDFLDAVLRGEGWTQYNLLTDQEVVELYRDRDWDEA